MPGVDALWIGEQVLRPAPARNPICMHISAPSAYQILMDASCEAEIRRPESVMHRSETLFVCLVSITDTHVWLSRSHTRIVSSSEPEYRKVRWGSIG